MSKNFLRVLCLLLLPLPVVAQSGLPGTNISATVRVRHATTVGDTTTVVTSVAVAYGSLERLFGFTIRVTAPNRVAVSPGSVQDWSVATVYRDSSVVSWWAMTPITAGDSTPTLTFRAIGLPGIATAYLSGDSVLKVNSGDTAYVRAYDPLTDQSAKTIAVGIYPAPSGSVALAANLQAQSDSACALGWITSSALCSRLHTDAGSDGYSAINQFGVSLDSARGVGSAVSDAAYWLLKPNAAYVLAHVPPPPLSASITADTAKSIYTAQASGGVPSYSYYWQWCASDCGDGGGAALLALAKAPSGGVRPKTVAHGWNDIGDGSAVCWTMSDSLLRMTVTDSVGTQVVVYYGVPFLVHNC